MPLQTALRKLNAIIEDLQDPDVLTIAKQWNEAAQLKGWFITCTWGDTSVSFDITKDYIRTVGDLSQIPKYIKGKHQEI
jgi:hypothetical protein